MKAGYLKLLVLNKLLKEDLTGYDLILNVSSYFEKKPSPGSMYPLLNELLKNKHIKVREDGRKKIYSITPVGKTYLQELIFDHETLMVKHLDLMSELLSLVYPKKEKHTCTLLTDTASKLKKLMCCPKR